MQKEHIILRGAREHNLKGIDLTLPRNQLIVVTGLSGSGKSSLAFDTIYAEGQRRYVESLSAYARQFLEQLQKPQVEYIEGLSPAIAIEQRGAGGNPRSTVATQTEIYDYLRLLFARIGTVTCAHCGSPVQRQSAQEIVERVAALAAGTEALVLAPLVRGKKGSQEALLKQVQKAGFARVRLDGKVLPLPVQALPDKNKAHTVDVVVDRLLLGPQARGRLTDSVETALKVGKGLVLIHIPPASPAPVPDAAGSRRRGATFPGDHLFSEQYACLRCGNNLPEVEPRIFSFNSPYGACPACNGLGTKLEFDVDLLIPDRTKSINGGAIEAWKRGGRGYILYYRWLMRELASETGFSLETPFGKLAQTVQSTILYGKPLAYAAGKPFEGIIPHLERLFRCTDSDYLKEEISRFMSSLPCPACKGTRLKKESLGVLVGGKNIWEVTRLSIKEAHAFFSRLELAPKQAVIAEQVLKEILQKLSFCIDVGLEYLTLERKSSTLSGGEAQRIRLATQVGSGLVGVLYILDEPSIGLHQRDNEKLIQTLLALRDLGNTLIVVEHDEYTIRAADYVVDLGPGAGRHGGEIVFAGPTKELLRSDVSLTARYLRGELAVGSARSRRPVDPKRILKVRGAGEHNLKKIDVSFPLGLFIGVTGVSGSGKSTLVNDILYRALAARLYQAREKPGLHRALSGCEHIDKVIVVDQEPIGRTPRSNAATYTGVFSPIRELFSSLPEAKVRGYRPGRFSFNVKGGRCEACQGDGIKKIEMHFLSDVYVKCDICQGRRFNEATLGVRYKGKSIADVLELTVEEALELFGSIPKISNILTYLSDVGLGYIQVGQSATTLSGGEAQRIKLATELSRRGTGKTLYILDEPTTGLHFADVSRLLQVLQRLVDKGNTVLVIEHNLDVIRAADYVIDLGPEGGDRGGRVVAAGTPEEIAAAADSFTGAFLRKALNNR